MADEEISLRPIVLRPVGLSGANPFSLFSKGSGQGLKTKQANKPAGGDDTKPKKDGERVMYTKEFMLQFMDRYTQCPIELAQQSVLNAEIIISEQSEKDQQRQALQKVVEESDDRDWRSRTEPEPAAAGTGAGKKGSNREERDADTWEPAAQNERGGSAGGKDQSAAKPQQAPAAPARAQQPQQQAAAAGGEDAVKVVRGSDLGIVRASDVGLQAYRPGAAVSTEERAIRQLKGILNKLTPEKFERLLQQLLGVITTADVLRSTIALVFENAVEQPTYCAMYADLCLQLSKELPSFPPPPNSDKPITFVQILLNTCQDEFEGAEEARAQLQGMTAAEHEEAERAVKKRVMGTMRLISELYKKDMVRDWIVTTCLESLLSKDKGKNTASEDSIEAACEMMTTAGSKVAKSDNDKMRRKLDDVFRQLQAMEKDKNLSSRIRFVVRDVIDLRKNNWIPRRETFTAKKLDEVRAQAEAELGMVSSVLTASLPVLPAQQRMGPGAEEYALIPPLRGDAESWGFPAFSSNGSAGGAGNSKFGGGQSALLGDYTPARPAVAAQIPASTASAAPAAAPGPAASDEEAKRKTDSLFAEYTSTLDKAEAATCVRELNSPGFMPQLVEIGLTTAMNSVKEKEVTALEELILYMHAQGLVTTADIISGLATFTVQLEDVSLDIPKAPSILGHLVGSALLQGILALDALPQLLEGDYGVEPKREFACAVFKRVQELSGNDGLAEMCVKSGLKASTFLQADAALDPEAPAVEDFLRQQGLAGVVPV